MAENKNENRSRETERALIEISRLTDEQLYEKYGSWAIVLQKAFSPNLGMDVICGLYDENYQLYIELGLVEEE